MNGPRVSRRAFSLGLGALGLGGLGLSAAGCQRSDSGEPGTLRLGCMANLTHAPILAGIFSERLAKRIAPLKLEVRTFRAGPRVVEALLGRSIDVAVCGPAPIVTLQARHGDGTFQIISGCASGGASLVVAKGARITKPEDLHGARLATPQIGCTQDVSLRKYLAGHGLETKERGGDVDVTALASATIMTEMRRGGLTGGWLPEPWATRLVQEIGATRLVDERDLWPARSFSSALVATRPAFSKARTADLAKLMEAIGDEIDGAARLGQERLGEAHAAITKLVGNAGPKPTFYEAATYLSFTRDPLREAVLGFAGDAKDLGLLPRVPGPALFV